MNHGMSMSVVPAPAWHVAQEPLIFGHQGSWAMGRRGYFRCGGNCDQWRLFVLGKRTDQRQARSARTWVRGRESQFILQKPSLTRGLLCEETSLFLLKLFIIIIFHIQTKPKSHLAPPYLGMATVSCRGTVWHLWKSYNVLLEDRIT